MNHLSKLFLIGLTSAAITTTSYAGMGMGSGDGQGMGQGAGQDAEFKYAVKHSNFMPTLMAVAMKNKETLGLSAEQLGKLKAYHSENSPSQREDMKNVVKLEQQAAAASLAGNANEAQKLGQQSIALRQTIMNQKLRCHQMMKDILSTEQYTKLLSMAK